MADQTVSHKLSVGDRYGRWTVLGGAPPRLIGTRQQARRQWLCQCNCGTRRVVLEPSLITGLSTSCGCLNRERSSECHTTHGHSRHGKVTSEYGIYHAMRNRCELPTDKRYKDYGARGITVDPVWSTYEAFFASMGARPSSRHQLDRRDNDKGYSPENCHWVLAAENMVNRRNTRFVTVNGVGVPLATLAKQVGIPANTLRGRLEAGWNLQRAMTSPVGSTGPRAK